MNLYHLMYISRASKPMTHHELEALVNKSSDNNKHKDITGNLVYNAGVFLQLLEGDEQEIRSLYELIAKDERHSKVKEIYFKPAKFRLFRKWNMRLVDLDVEESKDLRRIRDILRNMDEQGKVNNIAVPVLILKEFSQLQ